MLNLTDLGYCASFVLAYSVAAWLAAMIIAAWTSGDKLGIKHLLVIAFKNSNTIKVKVKGSVRYDDAKGDEIKMGMALAETIFTLA